LHFHFYNIQSRLAGDIDLKTNACRPAVKVNTKIIS